MNNAENIYGTQALGLNQIKKKFPCITGADELACMEITPTQWVLDDFLPVGLTILGGPKKLGKSFLLMQFARDLLAEGKRVFYYAGEDSHSLHKERQAHVGIQASADYQYIAGREDFFCEPSKFLENLETILETQHFDAVFVDTMVRALKPKSSGVDDYNYYVTELDPWAKLAQKHQTAIVMVAHSIKGASSTYNDPLDFKSGSMGITATADWILVMYKSDDGRSAILHTDGKMGKSSTYHMEKINSIYYEIVGDHKQHAITNKKAQRRILECIQSNPGIKQCQISSTLEMNKSNVSRDIKRLLSEEYVRVDDEKGYHATTEA